MFGSGRDHGCCEINGKTIYLLLNDLLDNQKQRILSSIQNSEELCRGVH